MGKLVRRHPFSLFLVLCLIATSLLWWRAGRHFDSVEFLTPKFIVTLHSEMRMTMITAVAHDDSSWEVFHNSDVATVDAPWAIAAWPQVWGGPSIGEVGVVFVQAHLVILLFVLLVIAFLLEKRYYRRRRKALGVANLQPDSSEFLSPANHENAPSETS